MIEETGAQLVEQAMSMAGLSGLNEAGFLQHAGENFVVFCAVFGELGVVFLFEQLFLAAEVHAGELDEAVEGFGDAFVTAAANHDEAQLIERVQEDAVLRIHGAHTNCAFGFPDDKCQGTLQ